jgi:hypothetical protein
MRSCSSPLLPPKRTDGCRRASSVPRRRRPTLAHRRRHYSALRINSCPFCKHVFKSYGGPRSVVAEFGARDRTAVEGNMTDATAVRPSNTAIWLRPQPELRSPVENDFMPRRPLAQGAQPGSNRPVLFTPEALYTVSFGLSASNRLWARWQIAAAYRSAACEYTISRAWTWTCRATG